MRDSRRVRPSGRCEISQRIAIFLISFLLSALCNARAQDDKVDLECEAKPDAQAALEKLKLPGVKINLEERCVDVASEVCLDEGMLELVACTKGSKEYESIVMIAAKPVLIHTALLLLGAQSGSPAMRRRIDEGKESARWVEVAPTGGPVEVFLVVKSEQGKKVERPISDFIVPADPAVTNASKEKFPTHSFLFAGSHLIAEGAGPRTYLDEQKLPPMGDELVTKSARVVPMLSCEWQAKLAPEDAAQNPDDHLFRWDGKFVPNPKVIGNWTLITEVVEIAEFDPEQKKLARARNPLFSNITFEETGATADPTLVWSGNHLMDLNKYQALRAQVNKVGDAEYLFVEAGGFSTRNKPDWKSKWLVLSRP